MAIKDFLIVYNWREGELDHRLVRGEVGDVGVDEVTAHALGDRGATRVVDVSDDEVRARLGEHESRSQP